MEVFIIEVNSFQMLHHAQFPLMSLTWGIDMLSEKLTPETSGWIWKTSFGLCLWEEGVSWKPCSGDLNFDVLI